MIYTRSLLSMTVSVGLLALVGCGKSGFSGNTGAPKKPANGSSSGAGSPDENDKSKKGNTPGGENQTGGPGGANATGANGTGASGTLASGTKPSAEGLSKDPQVCTSDYRALKIAIVVDNTGSNNCTPGVVQSGAAGWCGTDPIKPNSPHGDSAGFTERQNAIYEMIMRVSELDKEAAAKNASFPGSDVGILSFPLSEAKFSEFKFWSGQGVLPQVMTNVKSLAVDTQFKDGLWNMLKFTHNPQGPTPYKTGFEGVTKMLVDSRKAGDARPEVVFFITDGLPTDEQPSKVKELKAALGAVPVVILSLYQAGASTESQNAPAKDSLQKAWISPDLKWAQRPGTTDGYGPGEFQRYWQDLLRLPSEVSNSVVIINGPDKLKSELNNLLSVFQNCK